MTPSRLPYPWKVVIAAAAISLLIVGVMETRKRWKPRLPTADTEEVSAAPSGLHIDTLARIQEIIAVHTGGVPEIVTPGMNLVDLGLDPLTRLEVADALETAYRIEITNEELAAAMTVDELVQLVVRKQQGQ